MERNQISSVLFKFIKQQNIRVSRKSVNDELLKHPAYPSLLAISDVLNSWRVPNGAYNVHFENLNELKSPYIAAFANNEFVFVSRTDVETFTIAKANGSNQKIRADDFKKLYRGSILVAETEEDSGEPDYVIKSRGEVLGQLRIPFLVAGLAFIITVLLLNTSYFQGITLSIAWLTCCKTAGLLITVLLLIQSVDSNNPLVQKLCSSGKKNTCNTILSSKAAKIVEGLSWSEAGFFYFAGTWLILLFNATNTSTMYLMALINVFALPYSFYSIYYQWRVAKQWCIFCVAIQALFWLEFIAFFPYLYHNTFPQASEWLDIVAIMAIPIILWTFIKPLFLQANQVQLLKEQLHRFKYNKDYFTKALTDNPKYSLLDDTHTVVLGSPGAENTITIVSNPYCGPCASVHKTLDEWINLRDDIKLQVVFTFKDYDDEKGKVAKHIMAIKENADNRTVKSALNDWYEQTDKNLEAWQKLYPTQHQPNLALEAMTRQYEWCELVNIEATPTIFINGRRLPRPYTPDDIKYLI